MKIHKQTYLIFFVLLSISVMSVGQTTRVIELTNYSMGSTQNKLPFWLWANRDGKVRPDVSFLNVTDFGMNFSGQLNQGSELKYSAGTNIIGAAGNKNYLQINQLFAAFDYKGWKIEAGIFYDRLQFGGLSTSNGNLARSRNARPVPKIRVSTSDYKPVPGLQEWLFFRFEFDEGLLNDERYVDNAHLHHKSFYLQLLPAEKWRVQIGVEHFVMWGGTSKNAAYGKLPGSFSSYLKYITGRSGDSEFPTTDQKNVAGNQYGTYQLEISRDFNDFVLHLNLSHPFEDLSGVNWRNWPDNLIGVYFDFNNKEKFVYEVLYEYIYTKQQSYIQTSKREDNYYNNSVYISGATFHQMIMASPLFYPLEIVDGISRGVDSNRFYAHHLGIKGRLFPHLYWKGLATYVEHFGTYNVPSHDKKVLLYGEFLYRNPSFPFDLGISLAADPGDNPGDIFGAQFTLSRTW